MNTKQVKIGDNDLLFSIRNGDESLLKELYENHRSKFIGWFMKNHSLERETILDIYHRAFTIFYFNIKDQKIQTLDSTIETYLFGIGKNLVKAEYRTLKVSGSLEEVSGIDLSIRDYEDNEEEIEKKNYIKSILSKLKDPCKKILELYYFRNFSMESIANELGYKNESVAKKKKCLCLQKIREEIVKKNR
ncbi:sigma-70 family RNA polymerase sigma factor [Mangrovivirga sp. M17]|uniref:Sigma-70 family RNA polymerase sigma factor n=1 Tax=Mangrovivirga halotolerans TaxID=2993936 RepID=A0ABT3RUA4_9BACT|nr:sigma-70 family RNA polymerase sigma factor [Mangrovivirga halotolerans]MCX2745361.1 sigma-70 family RNA polymerase sigma factor [Mangrovivirga halotolerans]